MDRIRIVDVTDASAFGLLPPCADPSFDHRTCDYWEEADRGSKAHRASWLRAGEAGGASGGRAPARRSTGNPFLDDLAARDDNPFAPIRGRTAPNPFALDADEDPLADNPFAPQRPARPTVGPGAPPKLALLGRGLAVFGSYAKVLLVETGGNATVGRAGGEGADGGGNEHGGAEERDAHRDRPAAYAQFGPLSAYPRALRLRELYPRLPQAPLPAVITCIAVAATDRGRGLGLRLVEAVCDDLAGRGFTAVEAYPEIGAAADATSAASPAFWELAGFAVVVTDERFPVVRREL